jgi:four helix bundle protein
MKNFKKLDMWQQAMDLIDLVYDLYDGLPWQDVSEYKGQSQRAAISIASNIAEGSSLRSEKDKFRFMEIALGSAFELETQTLSAMRRIWCSKEKAEKVLSAVDRQQKMSMGFMEKLKI